MFGSLFNKNKRCPSCGSISSEKLKDETSEEKKAIRNELDPGGLFKEFEESGEYQCKKCGKFFSGKVADMWKKTAKNLGEDRALMEYNKCIK